MERQWFVYLVRRQDTAYIKYRAEEQEKKT
jgi:hypothetical protein